MALALSLEKPDRPTPDEIAEAFYNVDITKLEGWERVAALSPDTRVHNVSVLRDVILWKKNTFKAAFNVCLEFNFNDGVEPTSFKGDYPAGFEGHIDENGNLAIDRIAVNTKSFYR